MILSFIGYMTERVFIMVRLIFLATMTGITFGSVSGLLFNKFTLEQFIAGLIPISLLLITSYIIFKFMKQKELHVHVKNPSH